MCPVNNQCNLNGNNDYITIPTKENEDVFIETWDLQDFALCRYQFQYSINADSGDRIELAIKMANNVDVYLIYGTKYDPKIMKELKLRVKQVISISWPYKFMFIVKS